MLDSLIEQAKAWSMGKQWWWRSILLGWFGFIFYGFLKDPQYYCVLASLNLPIHEGGHVLFGWAGKFMAVAGGTITQLAAPIFGMWNFYQQKDFFAISLCFGWLSTNFFNISVYMADARVMQLDLVSLSADQEVIHDWNYLFSHMGLLQQDHNVAGIVWLLAVTSMSLCLLTGTWLLWQMAKQPKIEREVN